ncbi:MAG TPA: hypothetical protein VIX38_05330, partial [Nitrososphaeraceae archaeon]
AQKQMKRPETENRQGDVTLLWGVNVIASVIGTVLTAIFSMIIGFNGNLLMGAGLYFGAFMVIVVSLMIARTIVSKEIVE